VTQKQTIALVVPGRKVFCIYKTNTSKFGVRILVLLKMDRILKWAF